MPADTSVPPNDRSQQEEIASEIAKWKAALSTLDANKLAMVRKRLELIVQGARKIKAAPAEKRAEAYQQARAELIAGGIPQKDVDLGLPFSFPGTEDLDLFEAFITEASECFEQCFQDRALIDLPVDRPLPVGCKDKNRLN